MDLPHLRLGVNVDHVATVRNARGGVIRRGESVALEAFPDVEGVGVDSSAPALEQARESAASRKLTKRVTFEDSLSSAISDGTLARRK